MKRIALLLLTACIMLSGCGENSDNIIDFNSSTIRGDAGIADIPNIIISEGDETEQAESEESQAAESTEILNVTTTEATHATATPGISTTAPRMTAASKPEATSAQTAAATKSTAAETKSSTNKVTVPEQEEYVGNLVWVPTNGGKKYHRKSSCSKMIDPMQVTVETAVANGFTPCKKCY